MTDFRNETMKLLKISLTLVQSSVQMETRAINQDKAETQEAAVEELGKISKSKDVSFQTKAKPSYYQFLCMDVKVGQ